MALTHSDYSLSQLDVLEAESIHIMREVAAEFERPVLLFSGGKDSIVMLALAERAFSPAKIPFPVMHVDTGHNFSEVMDFRDRRVTEIGVRLVVASVQESIDAGRVAEETGRWASRNRLQTVTLLDAIEGHRFDAVFGGARRDEEKARAKERVFSFRDEFGQWDPKNQRPELWNIYNTRIRMGEHIRVFPLSNWTELDVWQYIARENLEIPSIYFAHPRSVFERDGMLLADNPYIPRADDEPVFETSVRYRTVGDMTCTGAVESAAATIEEVITEIAATRITERGQTRADDEPVFETSVRYRTVGDMTCTGAVESAAATIVEVITEIAATRITERGQTRADDRTSEAAMEDRKKEGYF
jgi:sulfate adenylyltransferase subunit 2